ncbi:MAG: DUF2058 family protein [Pseudomonadota bacterium]
MGSLQDQLLQSGLVSEDQLRKSKQNAAKGRKRKPRKSKAERAAKAPDSEATRAAKAASSARQLRDRELNQARNVERERKAILGQLRAIINEQRLNDPEGDIKHFYQSGKKIKQIWVTSKQQRELVTGALVVAVLEGRGHLMATAQAERLQKVDAKGEHIRIAKADEPTPDAAATDDAYAAHPVPDDLMW